MALWPHLDHWIFARSFMVFDRLNSVRRKPPAGSDYNHLYTGLAPKLHLLLYHGDFRQAYALAQPMSTLDDNSRPPCTGQLVNGNSRNRQVAPAIRSISPC